MLAKLQECPAPLTAGDPQTPTSAPTPARWRAGSSAQLFVLLSQKQWNKHPDFSLHPWAKAKLPVWELPLSEEKQRPLLSPNPGARELSTSSSRTLRGPEGLERPRGRLGGLGSPSAGQDPCPTAGKAGAWLHKVIPITGIGPEPQSCGLSLCHEGPNMAHTECLETSQPGQS